jgi:hypothetical protein
LGVPSFFACLDSRLSFFLLILAFVLGFAGSATLNVVANVDANDADPSKRGDSRSQNNGISLTSGNNNNSNNNNNTSVHSTSETGSSQPDSSLRTDVSGGETLRTLQRFLNPLNKMHPSVTHHTVDEDPSSRLLSKHIFSKMMIEASDHPFFKRVWLARHVLDETSVCFMLCFSKCLGVCLQCWSSRFVVLLANSTL